MKTISAADANRHFSALLREVSGGATVTVTSRGKPLAVIHAADRGDNRQRQCAKRVLLARLRKAPEVKVTNWSRTELYD